VAEFREEAAESDIAPPPNISTRGTPKNFGPPEITAEKNYMLQFTAVKFD
jgi:hypothetical protein